MPVRTTWKPGGFDDVRAELAPVSDPLAPLFADDVRWVLVKTVETLEALERGTDRPTGRVVAVVCLNIRRERPSLTDWLDSVWRVLLVSHEDVAKWDEGDVPLRDRYHLMFMSRMQSIEFLNRR